GALMQRRAARDHDFGELLAFLPERRVAIDGMLAVEDVVEGSAQLRFVSLEVLRRILDEYAIAGLQDERRQLGEEQRFATLHPVDAHPAVHLGKDLRQGLAGGEPVFLDVQLAAEN